MFANICMERPCGPGRYAPCLSPTPRPKDGIAMFLMKVRSKYLGVPEDVLL